MRRRAGGRRCGARAGETNAPPPSRAAPGLRPGALRPPARSSLTAGREACPRLARSGHPKGAATQSRRQGETERQKARPGAVWTPRWSAERRPRSWQQERGKAERLVRRSVLHPLALRAGKKQVPTKAGKDDGAPRAAKNRGDDACALSYPSPERGGSPAEARAKAGGVGSRGKRPHPPLASARGRPPPQAGEG